MSTGQNQFFPYEDMEGWLIAIEDQSIEGLYVAPDNTLMLDRRSNAESERYSLYGPRTCDLDLIGPERIAVPAAVVFGLIRRVQQERRQLFNWGCQR